MAPSVLPGGSYAELPFTVNREFDEPETSQTGGDGACDVSLRIFDSRG